MCINPNVRGTGAHGIQDVGATSGHTGRGQEQEKLLTAFLSLPERERHCLLLRMEGFKHQEIAMVLEISLRSVAGALARSMRRLEGV
ncbi:MAG TPA: sigma factor-like helix-turn-helix DNA-binding protein [Candidatus Angelobacter sp.]|nr:sigma factor-like helix-turn-helix DNA-binding protein [Candidatus Angelobacter sp.]